MASACVLLRCCMVLIPAKLEYNNNTNRLSAKREIVSCETAGQKRHSEATGGYHAGQLDMLLSDPLPARVLFHAKPRCAVASHECLRVLAEHRRATMINAVIKPGGRLLSLAVDHPVRELHHAHWSNSEPGAVRRASNKQNLQ